MPPRLVDLRVPALPAAAALVPGLAAVTAERTWVNTLSCGIIAAGSGALGLKTGAATAWPIIARLAQTLVVAAPGLDLEAGLSVAAGVVAISFGRRGYAARAQAAIEAPLVIGVEFAAALAVTFVAIFAGAGGKLHGGRLRGVDRRCSGSCGGRLTNAPFAFRVLGLGERWDNAEKKLHEESCSDEAAEKTERERGGHSSTEEFTYE